METSQPSSKLTSSSLWRMQDLRFHVCLCVRVGVGHKGGEACDACVNVRTHVTHKCVV